MVTTRLGLGLKYGYNKVRVRVKDTLFIYSFIYLFHATTNAQANAGTKEV